MAIYILALFYAIAADVIDLGELSYGDTLSLDPDEAFNVRFDMKRSTYLVPSFDGRGFVTVTRSTEAITFDDLHSCTKILYLANDLAVLSCFESTVLIDLVAKIVVNAENIRCFTARLDGDKNMMLLCQNSPNEFQIKILNLTTRTLVNWHKYNSSKPISHECSILWQTDSLLTANCSRQSMLIIRTVDLLEVIDIDTIAGKQVASLLIAKDMSGSTANPTKSIASLVIRASSLGDTVIYHCYVTARGELSKIRELLTLQSMNGDKLLSAEHNTNATDKDLTEIKLTLNAKIEANQPQYGLYQVTAIFKESSSEEKKGEILSAEIKEYVSILDESFLKMKEPNLCATALKGNMTIFAHCSENTVYLMSSTQTTEGWHQLVYRQAIDYMTSDNKIYALVDNMEIEGKIGTDILVFDSTSHTILKLDSTKINTLDKQLQFEAKYIMNKNQETTETLILNISKKHLELRSRMNPQVSRSLAVHEGNQYWWSMPFDNSMIEGPYGNVKAKSPNNALLSVRGLLEYELIDEHGSQINGVFISLNDYILKVEQKNKTYTLHRCYPFVSKTMKTWCIDLKRTIRIDGDILDVKQTRNHLTVLHKEGPQQHTITFISLLKDKRVRHDLCSDMNTYSVAAFGNSVLFAVICGGKRVEIWNKHLLNEKSPEKMIDYTNNTAPKVFCPQSLHVRKDKKTKVLIFDECPGTNNGTFYDIEVDITGHDYRQIRSFSHELPVSSISGICGHRNSLVALTEGKLFLYQTEKQFRSTQIKLNSGHDLVSSLHCLYHGRVMVVVDSKALIFEIEKLGTERYHPYRRLDDLPSNNLGHVFENEDSLTINFIDEKGGFLKAGYYELDNPAFMIRFVRGDQGKNITLQFSNVDLTDHDAEPLEIVYPLDIKHDYKEKCVLKLKGDLISVRGHSRVGLKTHPNLEFDCELWTLDVETGTKAEPKGIRIEQAARHLYTMSSDVQTFSSNKGAVIFAQAIDHKTQVYVDDTGKPELAFELKIGDYCVDSDIVYFGVEDWYVVLSCFNDYKSYLVFASSQFADLRLVQVDGFHTDPRVRLVSERHVYLFTRLPHRDIVLGYYTPDVANSKKLSMFYSSNHGKLYLIKYTTTKYLA